MTQTIQRLSTPLLALVLALAPAASARAQVLALQTTANARLASRDSLNAAADEFDRLAASTAYSAELRAHARSEAEAVRRRLTQGDFKVGDRILLRVEGQVMLDDTVTVIEGQRIVVRGIRQVGLAGILRSELEPTLRAELGEVMRNATVTASPLMRVAVLGSVVRPGFLSVTDQTTMDRVISLAGGPVALAAISKIKIQRADTVVMKEAEVQRFMAAGATVGAMGMLDGDVVDVPLAPERFERAQRIQLFTSVVFPLLTLLIVRR